jgi:hypothetical protein
MEAVGKMTVTVRYTVLCFDMFLIWSVVITVLLDPGILQRLQPAAGQIKPFVSC